MVCLSLNFHLSECEESQIISILDLPALLNVYGCLPLERGHLLFTQRSAKRLDQSDENFPHSQKASESRIKTNSPFLLPFHWRLVVISADVSCTPRDQCLFPTETDERGPSWSSYPSPPPMDVQGHVCGSTFGSNYVWAASSNTVLSCRPQRIAEPEGFSTYFRVLLTAHLPRLKSGSEDEMEREREMQH